MSIQTSSRRAVIVTALAGMAGGCAPAALASTPPDAELVRLGAEFDRAFRLWRPVWCEMSSAHTAWGKEICSRRLTFEANGDAVHRLYSDLCEAADAANEAALEELDALAARISAIRPTTSRGLQLTPR